jgi:hypothetical protein
MRLILVTGDLAFQRAYNISDQQFRYVTETLLIQSDCRTKRKVVTNVHCKYAGENYHSPIRRQSLAWCSGLASTGESTQREF